MTSSSMPFSNPDSAAESNLSASGVSVIPSEFDQAYLEFKLMLRYALSEGLELDEATRKSVLSIEQLVSDSQKVRLNETPTPSGVAVPPEPSFPVFPNNLVALPKEPEFGEQLLEAHGALARLISPATPLSLAATEPGRFGYLSNPPLIRWMIFIALFSVVGFLVTSIVLGSSKP